MSQYSEQIAKRTNIKTTESFFLFLLFFFLLFFCFVLLLLFFGEGASVALGSDGQCPYLKLSNIKLLACQDNYDLYAKY